MLLEEESLVSCMEWDNLIHYFLNVRKQKNKMIKKSRGDINEGIDFKIYKILF